MKGKVYIVFFDASMDTPNERKQYRSFLRALQGLGFEMLQRSVYVRYSNSSRPTDIQSKYVASLLPESISACMLTVTADVFNNMSIWNGAIPDILKQEDVVFI